MNVICILADTLRRDHLGLYGNKTIQTPNFDRFAERSVVFDNSFMGSYPCMPARQDLMTGKLNFLQRGWSPMEYTEKDLISQLRNYDKKTMLITDHYHFWQAGAGNYHFSYHGTDFIRGQENDNYLTDPDAEIRWPADSSKLHQKWEQYARNTAYRKKEEDYFTAKVFGSAVSWIDRNKNLRDFFLMIDAFDPHEPFDPPEEYAQMYNPGYQGDSIIWPRYGDTSGLSEEELKQIHALYCGEITFLDKWFGKLLNKLEETGLMDNTMIIVTSDHGFLFGEHDWIGKHSKTLYNHIAHTPLIVYHPQAEPNRVQDLVQMADLYPTILEAMDVPVPNEAQAKSMLPAVMGKQRTAETRHETLTFGAFGCSMYLTDGKWMYVRRPQRSGPLYWYTRSHFQSWGFGQQIDLEDTLVRAELMNNGRIPVKVKQDWLHATHPGACPVDLDQCEIGEIAGSADDDFEVHQDELYDMETDYAQQNNLIDQLPEVAAQMRSRLKKKLIELQAPEEQFVRMGL